MGWAFAPQETMHFATATVQIAKARKRCPGSRNRKLSPAKE
jgi:hypothetical protein